MNIQHSSRTDEWYTPVDILARVHRVIGRPDFDPASDTFGNSRVGATYFYTKEIDGLKTAWPNVATVFCNPPGGKTLNRSNTALFWARLMSYRDTSPTFEHAIFLAFSAEALQNTQNKGVPSIMSCPFCVPAKRLAFDGPDGRAGVAPSHSNVVVYVPGKVDKSELFRLVFSGLGDCT